MVDDDCYGWEEVYEAYGCSTEYLEADPDEPHALATPREVTEEEQVILVEPVHESPVGFSRATKLTHTLIPSPG